MKALMVDFDGTLARTAVANRSAYLKALAENGVTISEAEFEEKAHGLHWSRFLPVFLRDVKDAVEAEHVAKRKGELYFEAASSIEINWPLVELIKSVKPTLRVALVTTASRASVTNILAAHGLSDLFELLVTGEQVKAHKPDPEAYHLAAESLGVKPDECLIFEDSDAGVQSGKAFGGSVIRVQFE